MFSRFLAGRRRYDSAYWNVRDAFTLVGAVLVGAVFATPAIMLLVWLVKR